eukprot:5271343-Prymnesium_polylepis.2
MQGSRIGNARTTALKKGMMTNSRKPRWLFDRFVSFSRSHRGPIGIPFSLSKSPILQSSSVIANDHLSCSAHGLIEWPRSAYLMPVERKSSMSAVFSLLSCALVMDCRVFFLARLGGSSPFRTPSSCACREPSAIDLMREMKLKCLLRSVWSVSVITSLRTSTYISREQCAIKL